MQLGCIGGSLRMEVHNLFRYGNIQIPGFIDTEFVFGQDKDLVTVRLHQRYIGIGISACFMDGEPAGFLFNHRENNG